MVRHHQRPRGERHELPGEQIREGVIGEHDERHAGKESRIERQHALRRRLVLPIAKREQACAHGAEIDNDEKKCGERVDAQMRAEPRHTDWQRDAFRRRRAEKMRRSCCERDRRCDHAHAVNEPRRRARTPDRHCERGEGQQDRGANKDDRQQSRGRPLQPHAAAAGLARGIFGDQFDPEPIERRDELHQQSRRCRGSRRRLLPCAEWSAAITRLLQRACADRCQEARERP